MDIEVAAHVCQVTNSGSYSHALLPYLPHTTDSYWTQASHLTKLPSLVSKSGNNLLAPSFCRLALIYHAFWTILQLTDTGLDSDYPDNFHFLSSVHFLKTRESRCIFKIYTSEDAVSKSLAWWSGPHTSPASSLLPLKASVNIQFLEAVHSPSKFTYLPKCLHFFALKPLPLKASSNM